MLFMLFQRKLIFILSVWDETVSQTSGKVGPWPIWFYCKFRNLYALSFISMNFTAHCEVKLWLFEFSKMCTFQWTLLSHFGMYFKIIFADCMRGLWYRVTFVYQSWTKEPNYNHHHTCQDSLIGLSTFGKAPLPCTMLKWTPTLHGGAPRGGSMVCKRIL